MPRICLDFWGWTSDPLLNAWQDPEGREIGGKCASTQKATTPKGIFPPVQLWGSAPGGGAG